MIENKHKRAFEKLKLAFREGRALLMECNDKKTNELVYVVCLVAFKDDAYDLTPLAKLFNGDPDDEVIAPETISEIY